MLVRGHPEEFAAMTLRLHPFPAGSAGAVSGWAMTTEEVIMWCGHPVAPVPAEQISAWAREDGVEQFGLYRDERLVATASCGSMTARQRWNWRGSSSIPAQWSQQLLQLAGPRVIRIPIPLMGPGSGIGLPGMLVAVLTGMSLVLVAA
jgi:hypothetical protein